MASQFYYVQYFVWTLQLIISSSFLLTKEPDPGSLMCIMCGGVTDLSYCARTVNCTAGQECFAEQVIGDDASVFYNAGCKDSRICRASGHESPQARDEIQVCEKCCAQNLCNKHLCKHIDAASENKTCYFCNGIDDPLRCENKTTCSADQHCFIQEYLNERYEKKYRLGCETRKRCELLAEYGRSRRDWSQLCNECCHTKNCNRYLCKEDNTTVPPLLSTGLPLSLSTGVPLSISTGVPLSRSTNLLLSISTGVPMSSMFTPKACVDSSSVNCTELDLSLHICTQKTQAAFKYCPHFCGLCMENITVPPLLSTGVPLSLSTRLNLSLSTGVPVSSMITLIACVDSSSVNCTELDWSLHICRQKTQAAFAYCPHFCGFCNVTSTPGRGVTAVPYITSSGHQHESSTTSPNVVTVPLLTTTLPMNFTVGQCEDSSIVSCALLDQTLKICSTPTGPSAVTCPKYCKFC